jgi:hypothetical protein
MLELTAIYRLWPVVVGVVAAGALLSVAAGTSF